MQQWEYAELLWHSRSASPSDGLLTYSHDTEEEELEDGDRWDALERLGDEGWELIAVTERDSAGAEYVLVRTYFFKRPAAPPPQPLS